MLIPREIRQKLFLFISDRTKDRIYQAVRFLKDTFRLYFEICHLFISKSTRTSFNDKKQTCHFLICHDIKYVNVSKYAIYSFLRYNPDYRLVIHVDKRTFAAVRKQYKFLLSSCIRVVQDITDDEFPYISKGLLLLRLQGTHDIFLDVDTRTNGKLPRLNKPTALVAEFRFGESKKFSRILKEMGCLQYADKYLLNVTFVSWGGQDLGLKNEAFLEWSRTYLTLKWETFLPINAIPYFKRFVEQTFFSLVFQESDWGVMKESDFVGDKGIIESSYFGASGYRFGR